MNKLIISIYGIDTSQLLDRVSFMISDGNTHIHPTSVDTVRTDEGMNYTLHYVHDQLTNRIKCRYLAVLIDGLLYSINAMDTLVDLDLAKVESTIEVKVTTTEEELVVNPKLDIKLPNPSFVSDITDTNGALTDLRYEYEYSLVPAFNNAPSKIIPLIKVNELNRLLVNKEIHDYYPNVDLNAYSIVSINPWLAIAKDASDENYVIELSTGNATAVSNDSINLMGFCYSVRDEGNYVGLSSLDKNYTYYHPNKSVVGAINLLKGKWILW